MDEGEASLAEVVEPIDTRIRLRELQKDDARVFFTINDGEFRDYQNNNRDWRLCSEKMRNIIDAGRSPSDCLGWLPVTVRRRRKRLTYFALHFTAVKPLRSILDMRRTKVIRPSMFVVAPVLRRSGVGKHHVFTYEEDGSRWIVSDAVRGQLVAANCTGMKFKPLGVTED